MYSTLINKDRKEIFVEFEFDTNSTKYLSKFKFDTGAPLTTLPLNELPILATDTSNTVVDFTKHISMHGIISNDGGYTSKNSFEVIYHPCRISKINIGDIAIKDAVVWVTRDTRVKAKLLGIDIIGKLHTYIGDGVLLLGSSKSEIVRYLSQKEEHKPNLLGELPDIDLGGI